MIPVLFDRPLLSLRRDRAALAFASHNVLFNESAAFIMERLGDVKRPFARALDLGAHQGGLAAALQTFGIPFVVASDLSPNMVQTCDANAVVADEEFLPFAPQSFDLVASNLSLHWVNDLPGALAQIRALLKPEGLFLATLLGGATLKELRACLMDAELAVTGGLSPRLSPTLDAGTASALLQRAGFLLPVVDQETITLVYPDLFALMRDLRGMGETNAHTQRLKRFTRRAVFSEAARLYQTRFPAEHGGIKASFEIVFLHGWQN